MIRILESYEVITPESAEDGEASESGTYDPQQVSFRELVQMLEHGEGSSSHMSAHDWVTHYGEQDYRDGSYTNNSIHFYDTLGKRKYWIKALRAAGYRIKLA